jgi:hypothetical protein
VTVTCDQGHASSATDYCDVCGAPLDATADDATTAPQAISPASAPCPRCGSPLAPDERFCEACGHDASAPCDPAPAAERWTAVIAADREQFERCAPDGLTFSAAPGERVMELDRASARIGRRHGSQGEVEVEVDDPGVSHEHAALVRRDDGGYAIVDLGSTNGTLVDGGATAIPTHKPVALDDGARIRIGAWTVITIKRAR